MDMLILFIVGWFGSVWWPGIEVDAPKPGGGDPWWWRGLLLGIVGGASAIIIANVARLDMTSMVGLAVALAAGRVGAGIVGALLSVARR
ncbi:MAG TPA: hypothetical protein VEA60_00525 [Allosphingosinicella sp.]|nr:hypothetical protein [Allosphingosinicella sp.]